VLGRQSAEQHAGDEMLAIKRVSFEPALVVVFRLLKRSS
jgi:hypothetical protein